MYAQGILTVTGLRTTKTAPTRALPLPLVEGEGDAPTGWGVGPEQALADLRGV